MTVRGIFDSLRLIAEEMAYLEEPYVASPVWL
jgi:hypothetical protein